MIDRIRERLISLNYELLSSDDWLIFFSLDVVVNEIKNVCNITEVPQGLEHVVVERTCGRFLMNKKQSGQLESIDLPLDQVKLGDTTVSFSEQGQSQEMLFNNFVSLLLAYGKEDILCYRKLRW